MRELLMSFRTTFEGPIGRNGCRVGHDRARVVGHLISSKKDERKMKGEGNGKEK